MTELPCCPACGYTPANESMAEGELPQDARHLEMVRYIGIITREQALEFFEVCGADEGFVYCPKCGAEVNLETGEIAPDWPKDDDEWINGSW